MNKNILALFTFIIFIPLAHADVQQGAAELDWKTCVSNYTSDCQNACQNSEDIDCGDDCESLASDKCQTEGMSPPAE